MRAATDWRRHYERHPWVFLGAAFAGGLLLSAALGGRRRPSHREYRQPLARAPDSSSRSTTATAEVWDLIKGALVTAAGSQISSFVREVLPSLRRSEHSADPRQGPEVRSSSGSKSNGGNGHRTVEVDVPRE